MGHERAFLNRPISPVRRVKFPLHNSSTWYPLISPHSTLNCHLVFCIMNAGRHVCLQRAEPHYTVRVDLFEASTYTPTVKNLCFTLATQITPLIWVAATGWVTNVSRWSGVSQREITSTSGKSLQRHGAAFPPSTLSHLGLPLLCQHHTYFKGGALCRRWAADQGWI